MDRKRSNQRPQKLDTQSVRGLVFALAISSTIGFWAIFSRIDGAQSSGAEVPTQNTNDAPLVQEEGQMVMSLPPIPTLVPTLDASASGVTSLVAAGLPAPVTVGTGSPTLPIVAMPPAGQPAQRSGKEVLKPKKTRGGGATTSTRSSK